METEATASVNYTFSNGVTLNVLVNSSIGTFTAANNLPYPGFAIIGGSVKFNDHSSNLAPQSVNPYNVLWANGNCGSGGSSNGIDTNGIVIMGDNGIIVWNGSGEGPNSFWIQETGMNQGITLESVNNWPPRS